ncbi:MAG: HAD family hydrolase [Rikenellaceae bacterium]
MKVAIIYDFDGTLSPGNMQEYDFLPAVGKNNRKFWANSNRIAERTDSDPILVYLSEMIAAARAGGISLRREAFVRSGEKVELFEGVEDWFARINAYGESKGMEIEHFINSSGIKEMIEGTSIAGEFKRIFACSFLYDVDGVAYWPGVAVNYTNKTQFIFKINKGIMDVSDTKLINEYMEESSRPIPFTHMIYIGDGTTDIPCMRLVKEKMGHSIAVYDPRKGAKSVGRLMEDDRVNFVSEADYSEGSKLDNIVSAIIDKLSAEKALEELR